jgi:hypothetical protein
VLHGYFSELPDPFLDVARYTFSLPGHFSVARLLPEKFLGTLPAARTSVGFAQGSLDLLGDSIPVGDMFPWQLLAQLLLLSLCGLQLRLPTTAMRTLPGSFHSTPPFLLCSCPCPSTASRIFLRQLAALPHEGFLIRLHHMLSLSFLPCELSYPLWWLLQISRPPSRQFLYRLLPTTAPSAACCLFSCPLLCGLQPTRDSISAPMIDDCSVCGCVSRQISLRSSLHGRPFLWLHQLDHNNLYNC